MKNLALGIWLACCLFALPVLPCFYAWAAFRLIYEFMHIGEPRP
jgi:hypothetical protein